jgi:uncharacterized phiE125 gp8 family phage protein
MTLILIERLEESDGTRVLPVSLEEAKAHLNVEDDDQDELITALLTMATDRVEELTGRCLITASYNLKLDAFPPLVIVLPVPPLQMLDEITYLDPDGDEQTLASVITSGIGGKEPAKIHPAYGESFPSTRCVPEAVTISFSAGVDDPEQVPAPLRHAIKMLTAHLLENREATGPSVSTTPLGFDDIIANHRLWSF